MLLLFGVHELVDNISQKYVLSGRKEKHQERKSRDGLNDAAISDIIYTRESRDVISPNIIQQKIAGFFRKGKIKSKLYGKNCR
jgi:hypothetical protein